jgi:hypothetical protein
MSLALETSPSRQWAMEANLLYSAMRPNNGDAHHDDDLESWNSSKAEKLLRYASMNI